ncbi:CRISPR-associated endonuclease Cas4g/Cas1g [Desulfolucanica intricata]|uniref:CRISPR-associated endonuclease Cas4g/Cas1g n=1 Tax=Desulfolucanica intricata TaxID=1285191 RepID=UPI000B00C488|nr:type I-D CRISPR-associated endonuclease Cas1d [Desulfolucanica intricata]
MGSLLFVGSKLSFYYFHNLEYIEKLRWKGLMVGYVNYEVLIVMEMLKTNNEHIYLPISAIAEILYCPRNFYYRVVEGAQDLNAHVLEGRLQEDRRNERTRVAREGYSQVRSVMISSEKLRLIGVVDVVEEDSEIYPVEYKKGSLKESLSDDVQVCAQAMVLEEKLGRDINRGYIYYVQSRTRREVVLDESLRSLVEKTVNRGFEIINSGEIPTPAADARCEGCALARRCLPFEVSCLVDESRKKTVRPIPCFNQGRVLYVDEPGAYVRKKGERIWVTKEKDTLIDMPLCNLEQVVLSGTVNISAQLIKILLERGTEVHFLSRGGKYYGCLQPSLSKNSVLRIAQHKAFQSNSQCLKYAREFVRGKLTNMRTLLVRHNRTQKDKNLLLAITKIKSMLKKLDDITSLNSLLGIEGICSKEYFKVFNCLIKDTVPFNFNKRNRRPPEDPVNALLGYGYSLLTKDISSAVQVVGFDPYIGFLHRSNYGRPALALDLMEEFRPIIVDSLVLKVLNKGVINKDDFECQVTGTFLNDSGRKKFYRAYEERRHEMITHPIFNYNLPYLRIFELQARFLAKVLQGELYEYKPFLVR